MAIEVFSQTFQGATEGDRAATYQLVSFSNNTITYAVLKDIDNSAISADGVFELPEYVSYEGTEYRVIFYYSSNGFRPSYENKTYSSIKKIILHGKLIRDSYSTTNLFSGFNKCFEALEEFVMENPYDGHSTLDGVLYKGTDDSPYNTIVFVPVMWNPEGKNLYQPDTKEIKRWAFSYVKFLGNMDVYQIPNQIEIIGSSAFMSSAIKGVKLPENTTLTSISNGCFDLCKDLTQVIIPDNILTIDGAAFRECTSLPTINLNNVEKIDMLAFYGATSLASVESTENLKTLGECCFYGCSNLQSIDLEQSSITRIPNYCFWGCSTMTEIKLPEGLKVIGTYALRGTESLSVPVLPESLEEIAEEAFPTFIKVSDQTLYIGKNVKNMNGLTLYNIHCNIEIDESNPYFIKEDKVIYNNNKDELVSYLNTNTRKSFMVPSHVKKIGDGAFYKAAGSPLEHVTLPSSCEAIGYHSFHNGSAKNVSVTVPPSVKVIGGKNKKEYRPNRNRTNTGGTVAYYYPFYNFDVYLMGNHFEEIECNIYLFNTTSLIPYKFYLTQTAYNSIDNTIPVWGSLLSKNRLHTDVPVTLSSSGLSTMCRDFDVDLSETDGLEAYVAASFEMPVNGSDGEINMQKVSTGDYIPSRIGADNYEFHGVVLKGEPGATYTYHIGEQDYLSGSQITLSDEQTTGNMLVGAPVHTNIDKTDGDLTNFVLKNGWFRYVSAYGELAWNKAYLQVPTANLQTEDGHAKNIRFVFADDDSETTGISTQFSQHEVCSDDAPYYNLNGMRITNPQKGIYIRNGRKVVIR